jgi:CubicO group peptidase (beta-lactamase class C family)
MSLNVGFKNRVTALVSDFNFTIAIPYRTISNEYLRILYWLHDRAPVYLPGTTPSFSNSGFQIPAYALESITGKSFEAMLNDSILHPLDMSQTTLFTPPNSKFGVIPGNQSGWDTTYGEDPALSMCSSLHDIAIAGISILSSSFISPKPQVP